MAENSSDLLPWMSGCISEAAFTRENDAVTRALQMSLLSVGGSSCSSSSSSSSSSVTAAAAAASSSCSLLLPLTSCDPSLRWEPPAGRIVKKRKSRASKRSPITYITADPANFRELVQQVTGPRPADALGGIQITLEPPPPPAAEAAAAVQGTSCLLPTLDTSAFLLDRAGLGGALDGGVVGGPALADIDPFLLPPSFPTLDSWGVM